MEVSLSPAALQAAVRKHCPDLSSKAQFRRCTTGKFNETYFVEDAALPGMVLRIAPPPDTGVLFYERNMMAQEPGIHKILRERTDLPVAEIFAHDTSHEAVPRDFLLMERLPGEPLYELTHLTREQVGEVYRQVGTCLAAVHAITAEQYGYIGEHHPMAPQPTWRAAFRHMWDRLINDTLNCGGYSSEEADMMHRLLDRFEPLFDRDVPASLLHMDIWSQNLLVDEEGRLTGIVDWDRALWGDPEIEFAVLDYCGVSVPQFWEGYGKPRDTSAPAAIRQRFYLLYEVQKYILISLLRRRDPGRAEMFRRQVFSLADRLSP
jgi:aminoglycoside phosphotransferase (APT) family kinase protein